MTTEDNYLSVSETAVALRDKYRGERVPTINLIYPRLWKGALPAVRIGGRWAFRKDDLPKIAAALGLEPIAPAAPVSHD